jgi:hypothetical protein
MKMTKNIIFNININDMVKFKLTKHGEDILKQYCKKISDDITMWNGEKCEYDYTEHYCKKAKGSKKGYREEQIWVLMNIFGERVYNGAEGVFEKNKWEWEESII